jgi:hypothetical protein
MDCMTTALVMREVVAPEEQSLEGPPDECDVTDSFGRADADRSLSPGRTASTVNSSRAGL